MIIYVIISMFNREQKEVLQMERLDLRKKFMVLDIETANNNDKETGNETGCPFSYDIGYIIADKYSHIYEKHSFIIRDIFVYERDLMKTAYYGWKIPQYVENLRNGKKRNGRFFLLQGILFSKI